MKNLASTASQVMVDKSYRRARLQNRLSIQAL